MLDGALTFPRAQDLFRLARVGVVSGELAEDELAGVLRRVRLIAHEGHLDPVARGEVDQLPCAERFGQAGQSLRALLVRDGEARDALRPPGSPVQPYDSDAFHGATPKVLGLVGPAMSQNGHGP